jgi:hypothetical protein
MHESWSRSNGIKIKRFSPQKLSQNASKREKKKHILKKNIFLLEEVRTENNQFTEQ